MHEKLPVTDYKPGLQERKKKKISDGILCDSIMECKRKRTFLNCFKRESYIKEYNSRPNKKMKFSPKTNIHITSDPDIEKAKLINRKKQKNDQILQLDTYIHDEDNVDQEKVS